MLHTDKIPCRQRNRPLKDYTGQKFGKLTALSLVERRADNNHIWRFSCECGNQKDAGIKNVKSGHTTSCGCVFRSMMVKRNTKHGLSRQLASTYRSWKDMRSRCLNPRDFDYADYGARGIGVCERWSDFAAFVADMGKRPKGKTLDRIDVNGHYEPGNCRWADAKQQANNKRSNHTIKFNGETKTLAQWCEQFSVEPSKVRYRIKAGWSLERIFSLKDGRIDGKKTHHRNG
jgi:hypothetical protein